jgi:hypothetical protein
MPDVKVRTRLGGWLLIAFAGGRERGKDIKAQRNSSPKRGRETALYWERVRPQISAGKRLR